MNNNSITLLYLMSSLVILAAPFANLNLFSNTAMAQGYDNNYDNNKYSSYPTEDKKYECRTGPFEGFFTISVEFCKFKFDDKRKDNRTDTQGPPVPQDPAGPQGIQGIQGPIDPNGTQGIIGPVGPQGPSGITILNDTNTYLKNSTIIFNNDTTSNIGQAICDSGDFVINGGFTVITVTGSPLEAFNRPILSPLATGWEVQFSFNPFDGQLGSIRYIVHAICFDNPPTHNP